MCYICSINYSTGDIVAVARTGRPPELNSDLYQRLLDAVPKVIIQRHVAASCGVHEDVFARWLKRGTEEHREGINSIYAQFRMDYHDARTKVVREKLEIITNNPELRAGNSWILEKCFREDFGKESEEMRELRLLFSQFMQTQLAGDKNGNDKISTSST